MSLKQRKRYDHKMLRNYFQYYKEIIRHFINQIQFEFNKIKKEVYT